MRRHGFIDKHPMGASILMGLFLFILNEIIRSVLSTIHTMVFGSLPELMAIVYMFIGVAVSSLLYKWWFSPEFEGAFKGGNIKEGMLMNLWFIIYWIIAGIAMVIDKTFELKPLTMQTLRACLAAGFVEEIAFRHGIASTMLRNRNQKDQLIKVIVVSSLVFGLIHLSNIAAGADLLHTFSQVITSFCLGIFFAAVYVRSGNILPSIILHTVHDIYAICTSEAISETGIVTGGLSLSDHIDLLCCIALAALAIVRFLSPEHREKIVRLWNHKWGKADSDTVEQK